MERTTADLAFLSGEGEMARRIREYDWGATPLGPPSAWGPSLRTIMRMALTTRHPVFVFWGPDSICLYNDAYSASIGPEKHPGILGMRGRDAWPEIWHIIGPQIELVQRGEGATWHENQLVPILRHGAIQDVYWTYGYGPIDDEAAPNGIGGVLVLCTETTEQVLAERRADAERRRLAQLFEKSPNFMCVLRGPDHVFEFANPGYMRLVGGRPVIGRSVAEAFPEVLDQGYIELLDAVYRGEGPYSARGARVSLRATPDAPLEERFIDFVYQPMIGEDGAIRGIFVEGTDSTERHAAENALRASEDRFRAIADNIPQLAWMADGSGTVDWFNRGWLEYTGMTLEESLAAGWHAAQHPAHAGAVREKFLEHLQAGRDWEDTFPLRGKDGSYRWFLSRMKAICDDAGKPLRFFGTSTDVTDQLAIEEALKQSDQRKNEFLAMLAHELRNPLAPIRNALHILKLPGADARKVQWASDLMGRQVDIMVRLVDDLLDVSRISLGKIELRKSRIDLASVIHQAVETTMPLFKAKRQSLALTIPPDTIALSGDPVRLAQAIGNLLTNASKFTGAEGRVALALASDGVQAVVRLTDDGIGIAPDQLGRIFELFTQVDTSLERSTSGLGIGLTLVRKLVEMHGGSVEVHSDGLGLGSEFTVRLPLAE